MFRDEDMGQLARAEDAASVWPVLGNNRKPATGPRPQPVSDAPAFRAEAATPDVPASIGMMLFAAYLALIGALAIATSGPGESRMVLVIAGLFVVAFFAVPHYIFAQEPKGGRRPDLSRFLATGMRTFTGHCSGGAALVQMFLVPVALTIGILAIAVIIALAA
jgi:hypothetical protein